MVVVDGKVLEEQELHRDQSHAVSLAPVVAADTVADSIAFANRTLDFDC